MKDRMPAASPVVVRSLETGEVLRTEKARRATAKPYGQAGSLPATWHRATARGRFTCDACGARVWAGQRMLVRIERGIALEHRCGECSP